jgi:hypothetical protein
MRLEVEWRKHCSIDVEEEAYDMKCSRMTERARAGRKSV